MNSEATPLRGRPPTLSTSCSLLSDGRPRPGPGGLRREAHGASRRARAGSGTTVPGPPPRTADALVACLEDRRAGGPEEGLAALFQSVDRSEGLTRRPLTRQGVLAMIAERPATRSRGRSGWSN